MTTFRFGIHRAIVLGAAAALVGACSGASGEEQVSSTRAITTVVGPSWNDRVRLAAEARGVPHVVVRGAPLVLAQHEVWNLTNQRPAADQVAAELGASIDCTVTKRAPNQAIDVDIVAADDACIFTPYAAPVDIAPDAVILSVGIDQGKVGNIGQFIAASLGGVLIGGGVQVQSALDGATDEASRRTWDNGKDIFAVVAQKLNQATWNNFAATAESVPDASAALNFLFPRTLLDSPTARPIQHVFVQFAPTINLTTASLSNPLPYSISIGALWALGPAHGNPVKFANWVTGFGWTACGSAFLGAPVVSGQVCAVHSGQGMQIGNGNYGVQIAVGVGAGAGASVSWGQTLPLCLTTDPRVVFDFNRGECRLPDGAPPSPCELQDGFATAACNGPMPPGSGCSPEKPFFNPYAQRCEECRIGKHDESRTCAQLFAERVARTFYQPPIPVQAQQFGEGVVLQRCKPGNCVSPQTVLWTRVSDNNFMRGGVLTSGSEIGNNVIRRSTGWYDDGSVCRYFKVLNGNFDEEWINDRVGESRVSRTVRFYRFLTGPAGPGFESTISLLIE